MSQILIGVFMSAELNDKNEVVITMSRGQAQRVANAAWKCESSSRQSEDCIEFAERIEALGIEFIFN